MEIKKLSTALLSDILDEEGYTNQMLPIEIKPNFPQAKIFGKARNMSLKEIGRNEKYTEVYKGLYFLESLNEGEIIVISNAFEDKAFFGELMSTLSQKRKLSGAVIDGCTRDRAETIKLGFPVFAKNNYARDIKKRGVVDKLDGDVEIGGVKIRKGDYLFGDLDGVIVIPYEIREKIIAKALKIHANEEEIKKSIKKGTSVEKLLKNFGEF